MKVLFEIGGGIYPTKVGGMEIFNYYFIRELANIEDVSYTSYGSYDHHKGKYIRSHYIRPTKYLSPIQLGFNILFHRPDVVIISYSEAHSIMWHLYNKVLNVLKIPYIVVIHHGKVPGRDGFERYNSFFNDAKCVVAVSDDIKRNYDNLFGIDCIVIPPLVPFDNVTDRKESLFEKYGLPSTGTLIGMVGTIKGMKNPDTLIKAIAAMTHEELREYNPYAVFAGSGPMIDDLKKLSRDLNISDRVRFLGFVPKEQVGEIMKCLDYYVIASDYEGTSVSLLEAMFNKKPILASNVIGINDTVSENECVFFEVKQHIDLKDKLVTLFADKAKTQFFAENAYKRYMQTYDYSIMLNKYIEILR